MLLPPKEEVPANILRSQMILFFFLGLNVFLPVYILRSEQNAILRDIDQEKHIPYTFLIYGLFGFIFDFLNMRFLVSVKHITKIVCTVISNTLGYFFLYLCLLQKSFILYTFGVILIAITVCIQATTVFGYAKSFDIKIMMTITIAMGISGIIGCGGCLILSKLKIDYRYAFLAVVVMQFFMVSLFRATLSLLNYQRGHNSLEDLDNPEQLKNLEKSESNINKKVECETLPVFFSKLKYYLAAFFFNMFIYNIISIIGVKIIETKQNPEKKDSFFEYFQLITQIGVFIGKFGTRVYIYQNLLVVCFLSLFFFLLIFFLIWINDVDIYTHTVLNLVSSVLYGYSYSLTLCLIMLDKKIDRSEKEGSVTIKGFILSCALFCAQLISYVVQEVFK